MTSVFEAQANIGDQDPLPTGGMFIFVQEINKDKYTSVYTFIAIPSNINSKVLLYHNNYLSVIIIHRTTVLYLS